MDKYTTSGNGKWNKNEYIECRTFNKPGYNTNILPLQEMRWRNDKTTKEDKTIFFSGRQDERHENGVGFVVSDDMLTQVK